ISGVLILLFFGLPVFFTGLTFQGIAFEKQIFFYVCLLVGLIAWVSKGIITGDMQIRRTPLDIPVLLFWVFYGVTVVFSVDRWHSFWGFFGDPSRGFIGVTALILAFYFILSHFTEKRFYSMLTAFLASGVFVTLWSFLVIMKLHFLPKALEQYAPLSLIGTVSTLVLFLSILVPLLITGIFVLWREGNRFKKMSRNVLTGVLVVTLLLDLFLLLALYPFVSWIVLLGGLGFFLIYILAQIVRPAGEWTWMPMVIFIVTLSFLMIGSNKLARATLPIEVTPNTKLSWEIAKESMKDHFLTGTGAATYGYNFSLYRPQEFNGNALYTLRFYQGTGLVFEAIPTIGVIGTVLMLVIWFSFLSIGLYLLTLDKTKNKILSLGFWSSSVMLFIAGFISPINGTILVMGVLLSTLSLGVILWESASEERYLRLSFKATPKFALALAFVFMVVSAGVAFLFVFIGKVFTADMLAGKAARSQASIETTIPEFSRAMRLYPQEGRYFTRYAQENMSLANAEGARGTADRDVNKIAFYVREAVASGEKSKEIMPNDVLTTEALGLVYENASLFASDALPKAEEQYARAMELEPQNPLYAVKLGQIKRLQGDGKPEGPERTGLMTDARTRFQEAVTLKPDLAVAHYNLAVAEARLKNVDAAIKEAEKAVQYDRNNAAYQYNLGALYQLRNAEGDFAKAEDLYKRVLDANERLIDVRLSLGLLYEAEKKNGAALAEYEKILTYLPEGDAITDAMKQTREQVNKIISNVRSGVGNLSKGSTGSTLPTPAPTTPATATPTNPTATPQSETLLNQPQGPQPATP
ncbi:MAG: tetratricopeptide repeat protein, partial [Candidatus Moraniibacteriota bacterium]